MPDELNEEELYGLEPVDSLRQALEATVSAAEADGRAVDGFVLQWDREAGGFVAWLYQTVEDVERPLASEVQVFDTPEEAVAAVSW